MTTLFGRVCHYPQIKSPNPSERAGVERQAINAPIQGSAADIIRAMIRMEDALRGARLSARMLLQVHDSPGLRGSGRRGRGDAARGLESDGGGALPGR